MESYDNRPIGVFDSGLGGLTVVTYLSDLLPDENFIYFGDTARTPYGSKSVDTIKKAITISKYFLEHSKYAYMLAGESKNIKKAKRILEKLKEQKEMSLKRSIILSISRCSYIEEVDDILEALHILVENGYIFELEPEERKGAGRKPDIVFELNPLYFKK